LEECTGLPIEAQPVVGAAVEDSGAVDEPLGGFESRCHSADRIVESPGASGPIPRGGEQWSAPVCSETVGRGLRGLELDVVELRVVEAEIGAGESRIRGAISPGRQHRPHRRIAAEVAAQPERAEEWCMSAAPRIVPIVPSGEHGDLGSAELAGKLESGTRCDDGARIDQLIRCIEELEALEEKGPLLGIEEREALIEQDLADVGLDLGE